MAILEYVSIETIIIVLLFALPYIIKIAKGIFALIKNAKNQREILIQEGRALERADQALVCRFEKGESRITHLEEEENRLEAVLQKQGEILDLLLESDKQSIKAWIKSQHDKWMTKQYIDNQALDLLERRFEIYTKEHGNSWALDLMTDLRDLPVVSVVSLNMCYKEEMMQQHQQE